MKSPHRRAAVFSPPINLFKETTLMATTQKISTSLTASQEEQAVLNALRTRLPLTSHVRCEIRHPQQVTLNGSLRSWYEKQIAQETVMQMFPGLQVINEIEVICDPEPAI